MNGSRWENITTQDSFFDMHVFDIATTPDGSAWFATEQGILQYKEQTWTAYPETRNQTLISDIWLLAVSPDGMLWGLGYHLVYFDGVQWVEGPERPQVCGYAMDFAIAADGSIWKGATEAVLQYDSQEWTVFQPWKGETDAIVSTVSTSPDGSVWVGLMLDCIDCHLLDPVQKVVPGVYRYDGKNWTVFDRLSISLSYNIFFAFVFVLEE